MELNPRYVEEIKRVVNSCPFFQLLGMELVELGLGWSKVVIPVRTDHLQPFGMVHGGVCGAMVDAACFWAAYSQMPEDIALTTVDLKLNYIAPVFKGTLIAKGSLIKMGKTLSLSQAQVTDENGKIIAHGMSTLFATRSLRLSHHENPPPKFL